MAKSKKKKPLELQLLITCDYATISKDGKLSIIGIFDQIYVQKTPTKYPLLYLVGVIKGKPGTNHSLVLSLKSQAGKEVLKTKSLKLKLNPTGTASLIARLNNVNFPTPGAYV